MSRQFKPGDVVVILAHPTHLEHYNFSVPLLGCLGVVAQYVDPKMRNVVWVHCSVTGRGFCYYSPESLRLASEVELLAFKLGAERVNV